MNVFRALAIAGWLASKRPNYTLEAALEDLEATQRDPLIQLSGSRKNLLDDLIIGLRAFLNKDLPINEQKQQEESKKKNDRILRQYTSLLSKRNDPINN